jgi:hypothetical protein
MTENKFLLHGNKSEVTRQLMTFILQYLDILLTYSVALSPLANYTDWATATCRRNLVPTFVDRGVLRGQRGFD